MLGEGISAEGAELLLVFALCFALNSYFLAWLSLTFPGHLHLSCFSPFTRIRQNFLKEDSSKDPVSQDLF